MLVNHFLSLPYSTPCFYFNQGQTYTRAEGAIAPPPIKKKTSIKKLRFALIYIFVSLSLKYLDIDLQNIYIYIYK